MVGVLNYTPDGTEVGRNEMATPFRAIAAGGFLDNLARAVCGTVQGPAQSQ